MKIFIASFICSLCVFVNQHCVSQDINYKAGYYITLQGDTIKGFILVKGNNILNDVNFKNSKSDKNVNLVSLDSCNAISIGKSKYINWYGRRSMTYVTKFDFQIKNVDSFLTQRIPLKLIYSGKYLTLYHYYDIMDHFFVGYKSDIQELSISYRYLSSWERLKYTINPPSYFITPGYRYQLIAMLKDKIPKKLTYHIESCEFEAITLTRLFRKLDKSIRE